MGRAKEWMMEQEELQAHGAKIEFSCPNSACGQWVQHFCEVPAPDYTAEKQSDITQSESVDIFCDGCGEQFTGTITNDSAFVHFEPESHPELDFEFDAPDQHYDPFEDYEPPDDPFSVAMEALGYLKAMIGSPSPTNDRQFVNRLIFAGAISLFEAYLGDTLINAVRNNAVVRSALIENNKKFGNITFAASEIVADADLVSKRLVGVLKDILLEVVLLFRPVSSHFKMDQGFI